MSQKAMMSTTTSAPDGALQFDQPGKSQPGNTAWQESEFLACYQEDYASLQGQLHGLGERVAALRRAAWHQFEREGFPGRRVEEWRHTNIGVVRSTAYHGHKEPTALSAEQVQPFLYEGCRNLVVVNGRFAPELSDLISDAGGARVSSLVDLPADLESVVADWLGTAARFDQHPFVAMNTALFRDGVVIDLPQGAIVETPLHVLFLSAHDQAEPQVNYPRLLINAEELSQATIVETYASLDEELCLTCPVTEAFCAQGSTVRHYKVQKESLEAAHMATLHAEIQRDAQFISQSISHGGALVRNDTRAGIRGSGSDATLNGLYVVSGEQIIDNHMFVEHEAPNTTSHELFKGILSDRAQAVFNGHIYVHRSAQKTDAKQTNRNLLLSDGAVANSNPQLEIFADDVRCTHGSTTGHLEEEALFYLRSRGISPEAATSLLTYAFASEFVELVEVEALREDLQEFLFSRLPGGEIVRQAV